MDYIWGICYPYPQEVVRWEDSQEGSEVETLTYNGPRAERDTNVSAYVWKSECHFGDSALL